MDTKQTDVAILAADPDEVKKYLKEVDIKEVIPDRQRKVYSYIRFALMKSLGEKSSTDPVFAALIERIARSGAYLDLMEEVILGGQLPGEIVGEQFKATPRSNYIKIQQEHRKCIETFTNLRYAEENKRGKKVLEELRKTVWTDE